MMSMRDEQAANTTIPGELVPAYEAFHLDDRTSLGSITTVIPDKRITSRTDHKVQGEMGPPSCASMTLSSGIGSVNAYDELNRYVPHWEESQGAYNRPRKTVRTAIFRGLAGGIFFFGLVAAVLSGYFWPVFLAALSIGWLIGLLSILKPHAMYVGFQGFVFFLGLAVCSAVGWWPWILVMLGISVILEIVNALLTPELVGAAGHRQPRPDETVTRAQRHEIKATP